jgi:hypothetical protein
MKVYKTNAAGWSATEELRKSLVELGFKSGMPNIPRGSDAGCFWLFGEDVKKMKELIDKKLTVCIESVNRKFFITGKPNHQALYCEFSIAVK